MRYAGQTRAPSSYVGEATGNVPLVRLRRIAPWCETHAIWLKLEGLNPSGSIKDKNAAYLIEQAERQGLLRPGATIVESSSGNFGVALAMIAAAKNYKALIVIDPKTTPTMKRLLTAYGADLVQLSDAEIAEASSLQIARMRKANALAASIPNAWYPCQHLNPGNQDIHAIQTACEIHEAMGAEQLDAVILGVSTAGQLGGIAKGLAELRPTTQIIAVDVKGSSIFGDTPAPYHMTGLGLSFAPPAFEPQTINTAYAVSDALAFSCCHALARQEGLLLGASSGALVAAALAHTSKLQRNICMVVVAPDHGNRYLETLYDREWLEKHHIPLLWGTDFVRDLEQLSPVNVSPVIPPLPLAVQDIAAQEPWQTHQ